MTLFNFILAPYPTHNIMSDDRKPMKNMHQILAEMMQQRITQTKIHACRVDNRYYTPKEYMTLTNIQRFKLSLIRDAMNRHPGSYDMSPGTFPAGYFDTTN